MKLNHFEGKSVVEHLKAARLKGMAALAESHGVEMPGYLTSGLDSMRDTALVLCLAWMVFPATPKLLLAFSLAFLVWKGGRSALLGWNRLGRLHRVIEEERWEIEHHREDEGEELRALYLAKGLSGQLLDEVVTVLMADDNRLLQVMLEEEMGLTIESYEHPLKQALGAVLGVVLAALLFMAAYLTHPAGPLIATAMSIGITVVGSFEKRSSLDIVVWNLSVPAFAVAVAYFLKTIIS